MFILVSNPMSEYSTEYYLGKTYRFQYEYYPYVSKEIEVAKKYKSQKVADNACKKLNEKLALQEFKVKKI